MNKLFELFSADISAVKVIISTLIATVGGVVTSFLGGFDSLLVTLVTLIVIDYVTGVVRAIYLKKLSSSVGFRGIIKKFLMLIVVGLSVTLSNILPEGLPLREITILFFIANEGFSVLENAAQVIPLPKKLSSVLEQIQNRAEDLSEQEQDKRDKEEE